MPLFIQYHPKEKIDPLLSTIFPKLFCSLSIMVHFWKMQVWI